MFRKIFVLTLVVCVQVFVASAQRGKDGSKLITATGVVLNEYTRLTANATAGATSISVSASGLNANNRFAASLAAGDLIFIIQMQGTSIAGGRYWPEYGYITSYNNCGNYEFAQVLSVPNGTTINLNCPLQYNYTSSGNVQVVRVPRATTLTVNSGAELTCQAWDGTTGGVLVIETNGSIVNNGTINATGRGFRGGVASADCDAWYGITNEYAYSDNTKGGQKGEAIIAWTAMPDGQYMCGSAANGGGGGNAHNAGGGGGSNASNNFSWNGCGFPDTTTNTNYIQAWDLEPTATVPSGLPFHRNASYGGGRGGYTFSYNKQNPLTNAPAQASWGGDNRRINGGQGGWPLNSLGGKIFMGGGGGGGSQNDNYGGTGGNGGGIVYLMSYGSVSGTGLITANGNVGANAAGSAAWNGHAGTDGAGGGGGGGAILVNAVGTITGVTLQAIGGKGGDMVKTKGWAAANNGEAEGPGGGGGGGYTAVSNGTVTREVYGGANGVCTAGSSGDFGVEEFPPNGATKGGPGVNNASVSNFSISASNVLACQGQPAILVAGIIGSLPSGTTYGWYNSEVGGTLISNNDTLFISNPQTNATYYFGTCPGTYRVAVTLTVSPFAPDAGPNQNLCAGSSVQLNATGGISYLWTPATGLSSTIISNPICTASINTTYRVRITNADGCVAWDSVKINIIPAANPTITPHTPVCINATPFNFTAAQSGGTWTGTGITSSTAGTFNPATAGAGSFVIQYAIGGLCPASDTTTIIVNPLPLVNLGHDTTFCQGPTLTLNAGNPGSAYLWQDGSTSQTYDASSSGVYWVQVTTAAGCARRDSLSLFVLPWANATITPHAAVCYGSPAFNFSAAQGGGSWSGTGITHTGNGTFNPLVSGAGNFQIVYSIGGLCPDSDTTYIQVNPLPVVNLGNDTTLCSGQPLTLNAGNPGSLYLWQDGSSGQTFSPLTSGLCWVEVTSAASCQKRDSVNVTFLPWANATITTPAPRCIDAGVFNLSAAQGGGTWSGTGITGPATGTFDPSVSGAGNFIITYTISGLCGNSDTATVRILPLPAVFLGNDTTLCQGSSLTLDAGNPGSGYLWQDNTTAQTYLVTTQGYYSVTVTDPGGCINHDGIQVSYLPWADASITPQSPVCINVLPFSLTAADPGGTWSGNGIISPSAGTFSPLAAGAGYHIITYSISGLCGDTDTTGIRVYPAPEVVLHSFQESCKGSSDGYISSTVTGGTPPYTYLWSTGDTSVSITHLNPGLYNLVVTDKNHCSLTAGEQLETSEVECFQPHVFVPNIFSPNGDGQNDVLYVRGMGISSFSFVIYDRWGEKVFESSDATNGWDGRFKGKEMLSDVYVYYLKAVMTDGTTVEKKGDISLVR